MKTIPTHIVIKYREFDRENGSSACVVAGIVKRDLSAMTEDIKAKGIKEPLEILIVGCRALLTEGNHRLACAVRLGLTEVPVKFRFFDLIEDEVEKMYLEDKFDKLVDIGPELMHLI